MNKFEDYARRVIDSLPSPDPIDEEQLKSPLERVYRNLENQSIEKIKIDSNAINDFPIILDGDDTEREIVENGILASGLEALAIYKSIHHQKAPPFTGKWGIFIFDYALRYMAGEIEDYYPGKYSFSERLAKSYRLLYAHERFHFRFDCWVISHESAQQKPLYENYRNSIYLTFHPLKYVYEEPLANMHALSSIKREGIFSFAKSFILSQPGAYSNITGVDTDDFLGKLAAQTFHGRRQILGTPVFVLPEHTPFIASPKNKKVFDSWCPIYIVNGISPSRFTAPGIALPTLNEIEKGFISSYLDGRSLGRTDHRYYKIDNGEKIKIPNPHSKNVKLHEFSNIIKKAGLVQKEYYDERASTRNWKKNTPRDEVKPSLLINVVKHRH